MYMPRPVTAHDCGSDQHPGGDPHSRFLDQTMDQIPTHVMNHNSKSGYHSGSSRDEEVCHVSTRNRHEQVMEVVTKFMLTPRELNCHTCGKPQKDELNCDGEYNGGEDQNVNNNEPSPGPGVFQVTDPPDAYPRELGRPPPTVEPWSRLGRSRWLLTGLGSDMTQPSPTRLPLQDAAHKETCEQRIMSLIYHVESLLIAMSNLTRAKMASFIPEELPVDQIQRLMVSPRDSVNATALASPDCENITYPEGKHKELPDERVRQLDATRRAVIGAEYERRKYSIFFDGNLRQSDRLSVTLKDWEDFYDVVVQTVTDLATKGFPFSARIMAALTESQFGLQSANDGPAAQGAEDHPQPPTCWCTQPPICWSRFMLICHEVYLVLETELVQTWTHLARWFDELPPPDDPVQNLRCYLVEPMHTLDFQPICWSGSEESQSRRLFHATVDRAMHAMATMEASVIDLICAITPTENGGLQVFK